MRGLVLWTALAWLAVLTGCATTTAAPNTPKTAAQKIDPWENWNRKVYAFNDSVDEAVLKPVATAYTNVVPQPIRRGVTNFFGNVSDAWSAVNNLLQGKVAESMQDVIRVGTNTLFGLGGFLDVASEFGADRQGEDFGQTLGVWGMEPGPYVVWPLLGPSTLRDSLALPLDIQATPTLVITDQVGVWAVGTLQVVNQRANLLGATGMLNDIALDRYVFVRDAYLQRRRSLIFDGDPPDIKEEDEPPASAPAPAPAASGAKP
ncbi:MlaA family lipoprotein [Sphaerotilaceae bacterium SBD11-9]